MQSGRTSRRRRIRRPAGAKWRPALPFCCPFSGLLEEFGRLNVQNGRELADDFKPHISSRPFHPTDISPIDAGVVRQLLLRNAAAVAYATKIRCKKLAQVHGPSQAVCGLLAYGFKAENECKPLASRQLASCGAVHVGMIESDSEDAAVSEEVR